MRTLTDSFLQSLVTLLDNKNTVGVALAGSFARGEGGVFSDVDIRCYVRQAPVNAAEVYTMRYLDGYLVSFYLTTLDEEYASLRIPQKAIWAVPGLRQMRILQDKDGSISTLKEAAIKFTWEPLQVVASAFASWNLAGFAEEVYKILAGLAERNESKALNATAGLIHGLATTLLVQRGVLIPTENAYLDLAQDTAGRTSAWTRQFRLAIGIDLHPMDEPVFVGRGIAGLRLYCETARLLKGVVLSQDAAVIDRTTGIIREAGY